MILGDGWIKWARKLALTRQEIDAVLQWTGTVLVLVGQILTSVGPDTWPYNVFCLCAGAVLFLIWAVRVRILAQIAVNVGSIVITGAGVVNGIITLLR